MNAENINGSVLLLYTKVEVYRIHTLGTVAKKPNMQPRLLIRTALGHYWKLCHLPVRDTLGGGGTSSACVLISVVVV